MTDNEKENAYNCIKEILESYNEFIDIVLNDHHSVSKVIAKQRKNDWKPLLDDIIKQLKK